MTNSGNTLNGGDQTLSLGKKEDSLKDAALIARAMNLINALQNARDVQSAENIIEKLRELAAKSDAVAAVVGMQGGALSGAANASAGSALSNSPPATPFERHVRDTMSRDERRYYDDLVDPNDPGKKYKIASVSPDGTISTSENSRTGQQLREDFSTIQYNTLSPDDQKKIQKESQAGSDQKEPEKKEKTLDEAKAQYNKLDTALDNIEGHEAQKAFERGEKKYEHHSEFEKARGQIKEVIKEHENLADKRGSKEEESARDKVSKAEDVLRETLKKDVMRDALGLSADKGFKDMSKDIPMERSAQLSPPPSSVTSGERRL